MHWKPDNLISTLVERLRSETRTFKFPVGECIIGDVSGIDNLISALVEQWGPETHTFNFSVGKCTITLENVIYIFRLLIEGEVVTEKTYNRPFLLAEECQAVFGWESGDYDHTRAKLNLGGSSNADTPIVQPVQTRHTILESTLEIAYIDKSETSIACLHRQ
ncbi:hypothetical protein PIB30_064443 [Stylosanthes scabra]|uniref:Aminotransferase-like plant mobile domain-containing protein n=1 Tax=Stylosanthes scabra TaxID=79078 RepID=A0ABU6SM65_9FABA|nr:hypothetical protein [Stylosanthes scabra]